MWAGGIAPPVTAHPSHLNKPELTPVTNADLPLPLGPTPLLASPRQDRRKRSYVPS